MPLADDVEAALGLPTFLDRDTNVAALGEAAYGAGRGQYDFIYVTVSTGIGGSIVTDGRLFHGPDGMAGELGHVPVELDSPICGCGGRAPRGHRIRHGPRQGAREAVAAGASPFLATRGEVGLAELSARDVAEGEEVGDATCSVLMGRAVEQSRRRCVGFVNAFNPHRIIIGGAIAEAQGERLLGLTQDTIARECFSRLAAAVRVVPPELGEDVSSQARSPLLCRASTIQHGGATDRPSGHRSRLQAVTCPFTRPASAGRNPTGGSRTMATRVGINGFGRIGRQSLKALIERAPDVEVVAVNDLVETSLNALLFKHDSTYRAYPATSATPTTH